LGDGDRIAAPAGWPVDALFFEDFESGLSNWHGKLGIGGPETAVITDISSTDPDRGHVMQTTSCTSGGDAMSAATFQCSARNPCLVEYDMKGRAWQGFSDDYPGKDTLLSGLLVTAIILSPP
jgi:hypothetical protein